MGRDAAKDPSKVGAVAWSRHTQDDREDERGGLGFDGSKRYAKANSQQMPDYDKQTPSNYIIYEDANNLWL